MWDASPSAYDIKFECNFLKVNQLSTTSLLPKSHDQSLSICIPVTAKSNRYSYDCEERCALTNCKNLSG